MGYIIFNVQQIKNIFAGNKFLWVYFHTTDYTQLSKQCTIIMLRWHWVYFISLDGNFNFIEKSNTFTYNHLIFGTYLYVDIVFRYINNGTVRIGTSGTRYTNW